MNVDLLGHKVSSSYIEALFAMYNLGGEDHSGHVFDCSLCGKSLKISFNPEGGEVEHEVIYEPQDGTAPVTPCEIKEITEEAVLSLGTFEVKSERVIISDPCYSKGTWCAGTIENVSNGTWQASATLTPLRFGAINSEVRAVLKGSWPETDWEDTNIDVGVDSGQAGIFDYDIYPDKPGDYDEGTWYFSGCQVTEGYYGAGVIIGGVISRSGHGDGSYKAFVRKDRDGRVVEIKIDFDYCYEEDEEDLEDTEEI